MLSTGQTITFSLFFGAIIVALWSIAGSAASMAQSLKVIASPPVEVRP